MFVVTIGKVSALLFLFANQAHLHELHSVIACSDWRRTVDTLVSVSVPFKIDIESNRCVDIRFAYLNSIHETGQMLVC